MIKRGIATFSLDYGRCPKWLFERMVKLSSKVVSKIINDYGPDEFIKRIADPVWFQSLGSALAFDWNSSGLTTTLTAALKEAIRGQERDLGIFICGGKGKTSRKTPLEIQELAEKGEIEPEKAEILIYNSKMTAKVDCSLVQDGYQIYHHSFFISKNGSWAVVQQGMNAISQTARRYHWYSDSLKFHNPSGDSSFVKEPHLGISAEKKENFVLNLTSKGSLENQKVSLELVNTTFSSLLKDLKILNKYQSELLKSVRVSRGSSQLSFLFLEDKEFHYHPVLRDDFFKNKYLLKIFYQLTEFKPKSYEDLIYFPGVGPKTIRALSLIAELIYGAKPSYEDPARYSFAFGGKDGTPYFVDRKVYDETISFFQKYLK
ncbi:MAG: DUF763 domain-containing protein [Candidatus Paceibacterota bacterium]